ncbi:hypothetical protein MX621_30865 (plasmid) [Pseudomonas aeruginosa]|jgi:hypothetical protein|uniref:Uncharacterized protein n=2 Tax=Pseudomonas TaxID=286 RepID=A0A3M4JVH0_9PSED|nr:MULTISPECIES: hypothetical protein [Pseudomonas]MCT8191180.1 hypothetical protein [Pseudomonas monteilii]RFQ05761.1 hypothetical protein D0O09_03090 [Pseudomonas putida]MDM3951007.1 hypothetical protein [Pseudomonas alloputida]RMQ20835.1 hypothetical protein ALQ08_200080 [Pseudomonas syringae pv. delphinii]UPL41679.1 hypothetical protein MX621_30865 [Pseudomonas aeruginosa]
MSITKITECRECGSTSLSWQTHNKNISDAQHGRLRTSDIRCQLILGCDHCSETLAIMSADQVAAWLTEQGQAQSVQYQGSDAVPTAASAGEVEESLLWLDDFVARCNGDDRGSCAAVETLRAALSAQVQAKKVSAVALREAMENLAISASVADHPPVFLPASVRQHPLVMLGGVCVRVTYSGLKWYHEQLVNDRWEALAVDEFEALLVEALAKA